MAHLTLRDYQQVGVDFLLRKKRAMIADDPGFGKTFQATEAAVLPVLVVTPNYLVNQWADFINEQYGKSSAIAVTGTKSERIHKLLARANWHVINIEMMRTYKTLPKVKTVIFDESHHLRTRSSAQTKAAQVISNSTPNVYLLTGTPIVKYPDDLFSQFKLLDPHNAMFKSYWRFLETFLVTEQSAWGTKILGVRKSAQSQLKALFDTYALRRTYSDSDLSLPELIETTLKFTLTTKERALYEGLKKYRLEDITFEWAAEVLNEMRHLTSYSEDKVTALKQIVLEDLPNQNKVIFCWYRETAGFVGDMLKAPVITGALTPDQRTTIANSDATNIVATISSLTEGVDLSKRKVVIFYEEDYTPGVMYQALSRVLRHSPDNPAPVVVYYLHAEKTIDELIHASQKGRARTAKEIVEEAYG